MKPEAGAFAKLPPSAACDCASSSDRSQRAIKSVAMLLLIRLVGVSARDIRRCTARMCDLVLAYKTSIACECPRRVWRLINEPNSKLKAELAIDPSYATGVRCLETLIRHRRLANDVRERCILRYAIAFVLRRSQRTMPARSYEACESAPDPRRICRLYEFEDFIDL
jgi:hypothetical protein